LPSVVEKFKQDKGTGKSQAKDDVSPLVKQARAFALYLNPPPKPARAKATPRTRSAPKRLTTARAPRPPSTRFELVSTCYSPTSPSLSRALIKEPGTGYRWVRESSVVGHSVIVGIGDGVVEVKDGASKRQVTIAKRPPKKSLVVGPSAKGAMLPSSTGSSLQPGSGPGPATVSSGTDKVEGTPVQGSPQLPRPPQGRPDLQQLLQQLQAMTRGANATQPTDANSQSRANALEQVISTLGNRPTRVSPAEATNIKRRVRPRSSTR